MRAALACLRPSPAETALLAACLGRGDAAREAWSRWRRAAPTGAVATCRALAAWRTLLPLLARAVTRGDVDADPEVVAYLRAAAVREELRAERYQEIAAAALAALDAAGVGASVVRGAALAAAVYEAFGLRHCHDLDLLIDAGSRTTALGALAQAGFRAAPARPGARGAALAVHSSGLEIALHAHPFALPYYDAPEGAFTRASRIVTIGGRPARTPSPEATLVHVLGHATYSPSRRQLRWFVDAWHLLDRHGDLDWGDVLARVSEHRLELPVSVLLDGLAELGAPVPEGARASLLACARSRDRVALDVALGGLAAGTGGDVVGIWRAARGWRGRLEVVRWAVLPTPAYVRLAGEGPPWPLAARYAWRPARFLAGRMARRSPAHASVSGPGSTR